MSRAATASEQEKLMTLEEWAALDDEVGGELIDGFLKEEEMPTFLHEIVVAWIIRALGGWVRRRGGQIAASETKIAVGPRRGRKPDVSVYLPGAMPALRSPLVSVAPHIVVEVTSPRPRDVRRDRVDKRRDYAGAGIRFYWILDPQSRTLEVFERGADGHYMLALAAKTGRARIPRCAGLAIDLAQLWREVDEADQTFEHSSRPRPRRRRHTPDAARKKASVQRR